MDLKEMNAKMVRRHPWETMRFEFFKSLLADSMPRPPLTILDVGAGDAFFSKSLHLSLLPHSEFTCWDIHYSEDKKEESFIFSSQKPEGKFDLLMLMDVLEHVERDTDFLKNLVELHMKDDAQILISVPAWQSLFSNHDRKLEHFRRYSLKSLNKVLEEAGLEILFSGGLFHSLVLPRLFSKLQEKIPFFSSHQSADLGEWRGPAWLSSLIEAFLSLDNFVAHLLARLGIKIPGLSLWAICKKNKD